jgi:uncharacterized Fe-S cluster protein YjdI
MADRKIEYSHEGLTVVWQPGLCVHCGNCTKGLPEVFKPKERRWIQLENASVEAVITQVKECPGGAISIKPD